jgi:hypothetical protein
VDIYVVFMTVRKYGKERGRETRRDEMGRTGCSERKQVLSNTSSSLDSY